MDKQHGLKGRADAKHFPKSTILQFAFLPKKEYKYHTFMKLRKKYFIAAGLSMFLVTGIAYASSQNFLTQAQKYINENCGKKLISNQEALLCYLFNKAQEQDAGIAAINAVVSPIPSEINNLKNHQSQTDQSTASLQSTQASQASQLQSMQNTIINQSNTIASLEAFLAPPQEIDVFPSQTFTSVGNNYINVQQSGIIDTNNRRQIVIDGESGQGSGGFELQYSNDKNTWTDEGGIGVGGEQWNQHVQKVFPVKGKYYEITVNVYTGSFQGWSSIELY